MKNVALVHIVRMFGKDIAMYNCTLYMHNCARTVCYTTSVQHKVEKQLAALFFLRGRKEEEKKGQGRIILITVAAIFTKKSKQGVLVRHHSD